MDKVKERLWKESRAGARGGKGYRYQDRFTALLLVKQWAGEMAACCITPEGLEDVVLEFSTREIWMQIKSRNTGTFSLREVESFRNKAKEAIEQLNQDNVYDIAVGLQRPCNSIGMQPVEALALNEMQVVVSETPEKEAEEVLVKKLNIADSVAESLFQDLYAWVGTVSDANQTADFDKRVRITPSDVEWMIQRSLERSDSSAIDAVLLRGTLEPIDFKSKVDDPAFYSGVKAQPGHLAAGLIINRPKQVEEICQKFNMARHVLLTGQSGSGKSALVWLTAEHMAESIRWYRIGPTVGAEDLSDIIRFVRSRKPNRASQVGIICDELGSENAAFWSTLATELSRFPEVLFLGAVRNEYIYILEGIQDVEMISIWLDEDLAEHLWKELKSRNKTDWLHWRDAFEESKGLMLEYVHILTQGRRLEALLKEQVQQREKEKRTTELRILRSASVITSLSGEVNVQALLSTLDIPPEDAQIALKRLLDEHLVHEKTSGVLGGLHSLRSKTLMVLTHDELAMTAKASFLRSLPAVHVPTLPLVIHSALKNFETELVLDALADMLSNNNSVELLAGVMTGLGLATLEKRVIQLINTLEQNGVERTNWQVSSTYAISGLEFPDFPSAGPDWEKLRSAVEQFRQIPVSDMRIELFQRLDESIPIPTSLGLDELRLLLSSFVGMNHSPEINFQVLDTGDSELDIKKIAQVLETAYDISPDLAQSLCLAFGGEEYLLQCFSNQIPWTTIPSIEQVKDGKQVLSNYYLISDNLQRKPNDVVVEICRILLSIVPSATSVASSAIDIDGSIVKVNDFPIVSKELIRDALPAYARVAWNRAFMQLTLMQTKTERLSGYASVMAELVVRTDKILAGISENWIRGSELKNRDALAEECNAIISQCKRMSFSSLYSLPTQMVAPTDADISRDRIADLVVNIHSNFIIRLTNLKNAGETRSLAGFSLDLAKDAEELSESTVWRAVSKSPIEQLQAISKRLEHLAEILQEFGTNYNSTTLDLLVTMARRGGHGKSVTSAARFSISRAKKRLERLLNQLVASLRQEGIESECRLRLLEKYDDSYWPSVEIAIIVQISKIEDLIQYEQAVSMCKDKLPENSQFVIVPSLRGKVLGDMAIKVYVGTGSTLPDLEFQERWEEFLNSPFFASELMNIFKRGLSAAIQASSIIACRDVNSLLPEEDELLSTSTEQLISAAKQVNRVWENEKSEEAGVVLATLADISERIQEELEANKSGSPIQTPLAAGRLSIINRKLTGFFQEISEVNFYLISKAFSKESVRYE